MAVLKLMTSDAALQDHLDNAPHNAKYTSPEIQNELLDICAEKVRQRIVTRCNNASCFTFIADEASDLSSREQISLNVRFVEYSKARTTVVREEFLGFVQAASTTGEALADTFWKP